MTCDCPRKSGGYRLVERIANTVDVYCGGGGLTLGAKQAGFVAKVAIDIDPILTSAFTRNFPGTKLLHADASKIEVDEIIRHSGRDIDGVLGGPPCQGFSEIGRSYPRDPRRTLVRHFFRLVAGLNPKFFLMENVRGLGFDRHGRVLKEALALVPAKYTILGPLLLDAADFGAATSRPRLFIFGFDDERMDPLIEEDIEGAKREPSTVREAIGDLHRAKHERDDAEGFDWWRYDPNSAASSYASPLRRNRKLFTGHRRTVHTEETIDRFAGLKPGTRDPIGGHSRLMWSCQCPTLRAGTGSDRGSYQSVRPIHPSQPRVITVREAARLQGFPDGFVFHPTIWHSFRMIGNSVSPIIAKVLLSVIKSRLPRAAEMLEAAE